MGSSDWRYFDSSDMFSGIMIRIVRNKTYSCYIFRLINSANNSIGPLLIWNN